MTGDADKNEVQSHTSFWQKGLAKANNSTRCHAKRKYDGKQCQQAAIKGKRVCRMHGGNAGAPKGNKNRLKHGNYTTEAIAERQKTRTIIRTLSAMLIFERDG